MCGLKKSKHFYIKQVLLIVKHKKISMKILLQNLLAIKIEKKTHKIIQKIEWKHLLTESNLSQSYTHWAFSDYQQLAEIINSNTIMGGG
jgi:DNA-binding transcriptional regulator YdaS (Cro superfamily)